MIIGESNRLSLLTGHMEKSRQQTVTTGWNLSDLYTGANDPRIFHDLQRAQAKSLKFRDTFKRKMNERNIDTATLLSALKEYERIHLIGMKPYLYATLLFTSDTQNQIAVNLLRQVKERWTNVLKNVIFFNCELTELPDEKLKSIAKDPRLSKYRHFFTRLIERKPHCLSESEEKIISTKNLSGRETFINFYTEFLGALTISMEIDGKSKDVPLPEAMNFFNSPDGKLREKAMLAVLTEMENHGLVFKTILNALILDHRLESINRRHSSPMHRMIIENELHESTADMLIELVQENYDLARVYLLKKARSLGTGTIKISDVFAPLSGKNIYFDLDNAREITVEALSDFDARLKDVALDFFEKGWIDTEIRKGKKEGAFCTCFIPSVHPFISIHYGGKLRDILTLAHELGHGVHFSMASQNSYLNFMPPFVIGEAIATFTELLVAHHMMNKTGTRKEIIASVLDNFLLTVFRQTVLTRFEQVVHNTAATRLLGAEELCHIWWGLNKELYGNVVDMNPAYRWGWTYVPHIFHSHFYCFTYVFGGLLAYAMYRRYERLGENFARKVIKLMKLGYSVSTTELLEVLDVDPGNTAFWKEGFKVFEELVENYSQCDHNIDR